MCWAGRLVGPQEGVLELLRDEPLESAVGLHVGHHREHVRLLALRVSHGSGEGVGGELHVGVREEHELAVRVPVALVQGVTLPEPVRRPVRQVRE